MKKIVYKCCDEQKILEIRVRTPEGEKAFRVCKKHHGLQYFVKYAISMVEINESL